MTSVSSLDQFLGEESPSKLMKKVCIECKKKDKEVENMQIRVAKMLYECQDKIDEKDKEVQAKDKFISDNNLLIEHITK